MSLFGRRTSRGLPGALVGALVLLVGLITPFTASSAGATPRPDLQQVRQQVQDLREQAEAATEKYNAVKERITSLGVQLKAAQTKLDSQRAAVDAARAAVGQIAVDTYKAGDLEGLSLLLSDDPDAYVAANGLLVSLGDRRAQAVGDLLHRRQTLVATLTDVQAQQQKLAQAEKDLGSARDEVLRKLAAANAVLSRLTDDERARLGQLGSSAERTTFADLGITVPSDGKVRCDDIPAPQTDARTAKVIAFACAQVGKPYQWAGDGPNAFDCSGLTMMAWKQAGVSLPHNAAQQLGYGTRVSKDDLRAGDLVFFHSPPSHVAVYVGNGLMLHAPQTGELVKIVPLRTSGYVGAVRL